MKITDIRSLMTKTAHNGSKGSSQETSTGQLGKRRFRLRGGKITTTYEPDGPTRTTRRSGMGSAVPRLSLSTPPDAALATAGLGVAAEADLLPGSVPEESSPLRDSLVSVTSTIDAGYADEMDDNDGHSASCSSSGSGCPESSGDTTPRPSEPLCPGESVHDHSPLLMVAEAGGAAGVTVQLRAPDLDQSAHGSVSEPPGACDADHRHAAGRTSGHDQQRTQLASLERLTETVGSAGSSPTAALATTGSSSTGPPNSTPSATVTGSAEFRPRKRPRPGQVPSAFQVLDALRDGLHEEPVKQYTVDSIFTAGPAVYITLAQLFLMTPKLPIAHPFDSMWIEAVETLQQFWDRERMEFHAKFFTEVPKKLTHVALLMRAWVRWRAWGSHSHRMQLELLSRVFMPVVKEDANGASTIYFVKKQSLDHRHIMGVLDSAIEQCGSMYVISLKEPIWHSPTYPLEHLVSAAESIEHRWNIESYYPAFAPTPSSNVHLQWFQRCIPLQLFNVWEDHISWSYFRNPHQASKRTARRRFGRNNKAIPEITIPDDADPIRAGQGPTFKVPLPPLRGHKSVLAPLTSEAQVSPIEVME